jgi:hypothetical protein
MIHGRMSHPSRWHATLALACGLACCAGCRSQAPDNGPRASISVRASQATAEPGAPIEIDYRLSPLPGALPLAGTYWVFVHALDESGMLLWTDDHAPPSQPSTWGTAPLDYRRTMFVPRIPYTGRVWIEAGLFSRDDGTRVPVDRRAQTPDAASFEMRPASNAVFVSFGDGWHGAERDAGETAREWRWSKGDARITFRNPRRDAVLWLELDQPVAAVGAQTVELRIGPERLGSIGVTPGARRIERVALPAARLGTTPTVDLELHVQPTFVPASTAGIANQDTRELGVRVFNAYVAAR